MSKGTTGRNNNGQAAEPGADQISAELLLSAAALEENSADPCTLACRRLLMRLGYDDGTLEAWLNEMPAARKAT